MNTHPDLTLGEAAALLNISTRTVRRLVANGKIGVIRHNSRVLRIPLGEWRRYRQEIELAASGTKCALHSIENPAR